MQVKTEKMLDEISYAVQGPSIFNFTATEWEVFVDKVKKMERIASNGGFIKDRLGKLTAHGDFIRLDSGIKGRLTWSRDYRRFNIVYSVDGILQSEELGSKVFIKV